MCAMIKRRRFLLLGAALPLKLLGNPILLDDRRRHVEMTAEKVRILVGETCSSITGVYTFRLEQRSRPRVRDEYFEVMVPVVVHRSKADEKSTKALPEPTVEIKGRSYKCKRVGTGQVDETGDWWVCYFAAKIPPKHANDEFQVHVRYSQPHLKRRVAAYLPIMPPKDTAKSLVTFEAESGHQLKRAGMFSVFSQKYPKIEFTPSDRQLLCVRLVSM
jgi:hypothetical protein